MTNENLREVLAWIKEQQKQGRLPNDIDRVGDIIELINESRFSLTEWKGAFDVSVQYFEDAHLQPSEDGFALVAMTQVLLDFAYQKYQAPKRIAFKVVECPGESLYEPLAKAMRQQADSLTHQQDRGPKKD
jgi:hypothetical protein